MNNYEQQANDFLEKTNATISVEFLKHDKHFIGDTDKRDIYSVTIKRGRRSFSFNFGQSLHCSGEYVCTTRLAIAEKTWGKFCLTKKEYAKLWGQDKTYFRKNENFSAPTNQASTSSMRIGKKYLKQLKNRYYEQVQILSRRKGHNVATSPLHNRSRE